MVKISSIILLIFAVSLGFRIIYLKREASVNLPLSRLQAEDLVRSSLEKDGNPYQIVIRGG